MTQNQDVYRKVGRGGAGNFYPSKKADEAAKDLEAQELDTSLPPLVATTSRSSNPGMSHGGRGGAGNFVDSSEFARRQEEEDANETAAAVAKSRKAAPAQGGALGGRGGAGNWKGNQQAPATVEREHKLGEEMERKVKEVVDQGLKMPEKVHHALEKNKES